MDRDTLLELRSRVREATGADRRIDLAIAQYLGDAGLHWRVEEFGILSGHDRVEAETGTVVPRYSGSLDATLSLVERLLPGAWWAVGYSDEEGRPGYGCVLRLNDADGDWAECECNSSHSAPLALLDALLTALIDSTEEAERSPAHE